MRYLRLTLLAVVAMTAMLLQAENVLRVDTLRTPSGAAVSIPVVLENTADITGIQFDICVPYELATEGDDAAIFAEKSMSRIPNHTVSIRKRDTVWKTYYPKGPDASSQGMTYHRYRVIIYSTRNELVVNDRGTLITLRDTVSLDLEGSALLPVYLENVTLTGIDKQNVSTTPVDGCIVIENIPRPDLQPANVTVTPASVDPGGRITVSWIVGNVGDKETGDGWTEQISVQNNLGTVSKNIATAYYNQVLSAGGQVSRQMDIDLPQYLGVDGVCKVVVEVVPTEKTGEHPSKRGNNTAKSSNISIAKRLSLELSKMRFVEGSTQRVMAKLNRSGNWSSAQTFHIDKAPADSRLDIPEAVSIPAGQSGVAFYFEVKDDDVVDADSVVTITVTGTGYEPTSAQIVIEDNEFPALTVTTPQAVYTEGDGTFDLTITAPYVAVDPITVKVQSEDYKRFLFNSTATIPAGENQVTVPVTIIDDDQPQLELSNKFTVSAQRLSPGEVIIILQDNDVPALTLTLTPNQVSEGAGPTSVSAVLTRTGVTNNKITVKISDDSNKGLYYGNSSITMDKGVESVFFNMGPVENTMQDGDRTYTVRAAIWISSCSCQASVGQNAGYVEAQLTVLDNDGPALSAKMQDATIKEGGETVITVSRNTLTDLSQPLTVNLSSNMDNDLEYQKSVTIPAEQASVDVIVKSLKNDVSDDSHTVIFTVSASGYASGTCVLMVTDQTLPDARIEDITASIEQGMVGNPFTLSIKLKNDGAYQLKAGTIVNIYQKGTTQPVAYIYTEDALPVGGTMVVSRTINLPAKVGSHVYYAMVNPYKGVSELIYTNNTSGEVTVKAVTPFSAQVQTDKAVYRQGDVVKITGRLSGEKTDSTQIDVYMINNGARYVKKAMTDMNGRFSLDWQLYTKQSGHFIVGACYVDDPTTQELAAVDVYGLQRVDNGHITCDVTCGETYRGMVQVKNNGNLSLSGVRTELIGAPAGCDAQFEIKENIAGGETVNLVYAFTGSEATKGKDWEMLRMRIISDEGADLEVPFHYYARLATANLVVDNNNLVTTMNKVKGRDYTFKVSNIGKGNSGKLSLSLPDWMTPLTGATMAALNQGDTATFVLRMMPTADMQLNVPVTGMFGINCENGNGTYVNFNITPVSDEKGTLAIEVCDEYTYYTEEHPRVKNAQIVLRNPVTGALVTQGTSDENGQWSMVLPEGYYQVNVTADNHDSYRNNILVDPGKTVTETVNLSYQAIKVNWSVEETEVEDEYKIVTTVKYETNVPMPVVEMVSPDQLLVEELADGESVVFYTVLTNKGLINATNVRYTLPDYFGGCTWTPLVQSTGMTLAPQQSYTIPVMVTKQPRPMPDDNARRSAAMRKASSGGDGCTMGEEIYYEWDCGTDHKMHSYRKSRNVKSCPGDAAMPQAPGSDGLPGPVGAGSSGGGSYGYTQNTNTVSGSSDYCSPCLSNLGNLAGDVTDCALGIVGALPGVSTIKAVAYICGLWGGGRSLSCIHQNFFDPKNNGNGLDKVTCIVGSIGNIAGLIPGGGVPAATLGCCLSIIDIARGCGAPSGARNLTAPHRSQQQTHHKPAPPWWLELYRERMKYAEAYLHRKIEYVDEFFGDVVWKERATAYEIEDLMMMLDNAVVADTLSADGMRLYKPMNITNEQFDTFIERVRNSYTDTESTNRIDFNKMKGCLDAMDSYDQLAREMGREWGGQGSAGYTDIADMVTKEFADLQKHLEEDRSSVCSSISLQIDQTMTMTRQAFRGTLTIENGSDAGALYNVKLKLNVTNKKTGLVATEREFEMHTESLKNFEGDLDMDSGWYLGTDSVGVATIMFIPSKYAAPDGPVDYSFGGTLSYFDVFTDMEVTRELSPVTLTVKPSPELDLTYFMQRDLYGDDPLTEAVEPVVPGEFAVIVNNKGNGDATNVRMMTKQPKIIDNTKGLYIDFEFVSSQLNGQDKTLAMGDDIATEFGSIPAHSQAYAQWWLQSSLLGHFDEYDIKATHVSSYGNENLSLLDQVTIHELIHGFTTISENGDNYMVSGRGFLVNDIEDAEDMPDYVYFTDATNQEVSMAVDAVVTKQSATEYVLTVSGYKSGWIYGSLLDPTAGRGKLLSITRQRDNVELPVDNMWQTDRTLVDGSEWRYENRLHFVTDMQESSQDGLLYGDTYLLTFEARSEKELEVKSITGMEYESDLNVRTTPVNEVTVTFNKDIKPETFTADDVMLTVQGERVDLSDLEISTQDNRKFTLDLSAFNSTLSNGYYVLTVLTAGITDHEGYAGYAGKKADWVQFLGGLVQFVTEAWPANSGSVEREVVDAPAGARAMNAPAGGNVTSETFGSTIRLTAVPAEGYEFVNWTIGGAVVSNSPVYTAKAVADSYIVANFKKKQFRLDVTVNGNGNIVGNGSGLYDFDTEVQIIAEPDEDFMLESWKVDGEVVAEKSDTLRINFTKATSVEATFVRSIYTQEVTFDRGWNWFSTYLYEDQSLNSVFKYVSRIINQESDFVPDPQLGFVDGAGRIASARGYKVNVSMTFATNMRGHLFASGKTAGISLAKGWNWISYPYLEARQFDVITNAQEGDCLVGQTGFITYDGTSWEGDLAELTPGQCYLYKSVDAKQLGFDFSAPASDSRLYAPDNQETSSEIKVDPHLYPSTMNIITRIVLEGQEIDANQYVIFATAPDGELRGVSHPVGDKHYLTVYGEEPVAITLMAENTETGEMYAAKQTLNFVSDVVGSRLEPLEVSAETVTGIENLYGNSRRMTVYTLDGILVSRDATPRDLRQLPKGVYIVNGRKMVQN